MDQVPANTVVSTAPFAEDELLPVSPTRNVITCTPDTSIHHAAVSMTQRNVGSIVVVDERLHPLGIVTDTDLRKKVIACGLATAEPVRTIMSIPVVTISAESSASSTILTMMRRNIRHLCVTEDGTPHSRIVGIVSEHDVLLLRGNTPAILAKEIANASDTPHLATLRKRAEELAYQYIQRDISLRFVGDVIAQINDTLVGRLIALAEEKLQADGMIKPLSAFCWLTFGSEGRREQLIRTDQDTALVYEDPDEHAAESTRQYFLKLAEEVSAGLTLCGFAPCPGNNMASNPQWCQPLSVWKDYFHTWIRVPKEEALLNSAVFFDFRPASGDTSLSLRLRDHISDEFRRGRTSLILLAKNALRNPSPMGIGGRLSVEKKGPHKGQFDLKLRALKPLTDAARVLALDKEVHALTGTRERLERVSEGDASLAELAGDLVAAHELFLRYRVLFGSRKEIGGRYIDLSKISRSGMHQLKDGFAALKALDKVVRVRYQLDALGLG